VNAPALRAAATPVPLQACRACVAAVFFAKTRRGSNRNAVFPHII
jgi:hypothetical protein